MKNEIRNADVVLVYPFFLSECDQRKEYLYPQLGLGSIAAYLKSQGVKVAVVDGTFSSRDAVVDRIRKLHPKIVGVYSKVTIADAAVEIAKRLKGGARLVVGGPYASSAPKEFLNDFDVVVHGEGEITMGELVARMLDDKAFGDVFGISHRLNGEIMRNPDRPLVKDLNLLPTPDHSFFENVLYQRYWQREFGVKSGSVITARGCPYSCEYCSKSIFGDTYRTVAVDRVIEEIQEVLALGYDEIWFADDAFSLQKARTAELCERILQNGIKASWTCLCRVDNLDRELLVLMKRAGCRGVIFGIESLDDSVLKLMNKRFTVNEAVGALELVGSFGMEVSSYFMVGYLGDTEESVLKTVNVSSSLPFSHVQYAIPKPLPNTKFAKRVEKEVGIGKWDNWRRTLTWQSEFSERKLRFAMMKGNTQFWLRKRFGRGGSVVADLYQRLTDWMFKLL